MNIFTVSNYNTHMRHGHKLFQILLDTIAIKPILVVDIFFNAYILLKLFFQKTYRIQYMIQ